MPVVAIVGRPNVGKSTLFNLLIGQRRAIVGPERGITRDRIYGRWILDEGIEVDLVDTGGFDTIGDIPFSHFVREQTMLAVEDADLILCLFDAQSPPTPDDEELVKLLRETNARVIYLANKVDDPGTRYIAASFFELGISDIIEISALNKVGMTELREAVISSLRAVPTASLEDKTDAVRVSILGRPNVGKSLLLNRIIGEERTIVSPEAGTTRDYVDIMVRRSESEYIFVDTAGIRRKTRIDSNVERISVTRALQNINMSHVCLLLVDPHEGMTDQDKRLCRIIMEHGRALVLVVNKSDLIGDAQRKSVREEIRHSLRYMPDVSILFTSALTGMNVDKLYPFIDDLFVKSTTHIATSRINRLLSEVTDSHSPPLVKGKALKFYYITQTGIVPPRFQIVTNRPDSVPESYSRYLAHTIKKACGMEGIPIRLAFVGKKHDR
jgi:GTP-binding protein